MPAREPCPLKSPRSAVSGSTRPASLPPSITRRGRERFWARGSHKTSRSPVPSSPSRSLSTRTPEGAPAPAQQRVREVLRWLQRTSRTANCPAWFQVATLIAVENRCHWSLDVTYREDESRIRAQHLRENFAWLNRLFPDSLPQANLVTPGTGTGGTGFGPNVHFAGLRSSLELSTCSGVMIWPV